MKRLPLFAFALSLLAANAALANDLSMSGVGGSAVPLKSEHPTVRMVRETVRLNLHKGYYETTVDFTFVNEGAKTQVTMGFPERSLGLDGAKVDGPQIRGFLTTVDGKATPAQRIESRRDRDEFLAYWTKQVPFGAGQTRQVRVRFRSPYGGGIGGMQAGYDFTGGNWRGKVDESRLIVTRHDGAPKLSYGRVGETPLKMDGSGAVHTHTWKSWEAQAAFAISEKPRR